MALLDFIEINPESYREKEDTRVVVISYGGGPITLFIWTRTCRKHSFPRWC